MYIAESIGQMTEHMWVILRAMSVEQAQPLSEEYATRVVKEKVEESLRPTNDLLKRMSEMKKFLSRNK